VREGGGSFGKTGVRGVGFQRFPVLLTSETGAIQASPAEVEKAYRWFLCRTRRRIETTQSLPGEQMEGAGEVTFPDGTVAFPFALKSARHSLPSQNAGVKQPDPGVYPQHLTLAPVFLWINPNFSPAPSCAVYCRFLIHSIF